MSLNAPLAIGMMRLLDYPELSTAQGLANFIERCVERGLDIFDHADIYGMGQCEARFGEALRVAPQLRQRLTLISKADIVLAAQDSSRWRVKHYRSCAQYLTQAVETSLERLGVERLDGFLVHRPDPLLEIEEVCRALQALVQDGKVAWLGVSNAEPLHWQTLARELPLKVNQIELSLAAQEAAWDGQLQALHAAGLRVMAWSPLAGGGFAPALQGALDEVAEALDATPTQVALAWLRRLPGRPLPVLGSLRWERLEEALSGADLELDAPTWFYLAEAARGRSAP